MSAVIVVTDRAVHMEEAFFDNDFDPDLPSLKLRIFLAIFLIMIDQTFWQCGNDASTLWQCGNSVFSPLIMIDLPPLPLCSHLKPHFPGYRNIPHSPAGNFNIPGISSIFLYSWNYFNISIFFELFQYFYILGIISIVLYSWIYLNISIFLELFK